MLETISFCLFEIQEAICCIYIFLYFNLHTKAQSQFKKRSLFLLQIAQTVTVKQNRADRESPGGEEYTCPIIWNGSLHDRDTETQTLLKFPSLVNISAPDL